MLLCRVGRTLGRDGALSGVAATSLSQRLQTLSSDGGQRHLAWWSRSRTGSEALTTRRRTLPSTTVSSRELASQYQRRWHASTPPPSQSATPASQSATPPLTTPSNPSSSPPPPTSTPKLTNILPSLTPHENIYTIPNILTASRLIAAPFIGYCILHDQHAWALGLFAYAGISDLLDGWIARKWNLGTVVGTVIDPMADKMLMTVLTVALAVKGALPLWLAVLVLGRDVALGIAAIYYRWISLPPPKTFMRYWDFSLPSAEVHPTTISKYNTFLQLGLMGMTTMAPLVPVEFIGTPLMVMQAVVAVTTVWSGASYVYSKDAVKILSQKEIEERQGGSKKQE